MVVHTSNTVATEFKLKDFTQGLIIDSIKASSTIEILKGGKTIGETTVVPKMPVLTYFSLCNAMVGGKLPFLIYSEDGDLLQGLHLLVSYGGVLELDNDDVYYIVKMTGLASAQTVTYRNWDSLSGGSPFKITKFALDEDKTDERVDVSNVDLVAYPFSLQTKMYVSILSEYKNAQGQNARRDVSYDFKTLISQDDMLKNTHTAIREGSQILESGSLGVNIVQKLSNLAPTRQGLVSIPEIRFHNMNGEDFVYFLTIQR